MNAGDGREAGELFALFPPPQDQSNIERKGAICQVRHTVQPIAAPKGESSTPSGTRPGGLRIFNPIGALMRRMSAASPRPSGRDALANLIHQRGGAGSKPAPPSERTNPLDAVEGCAHSPRCVRL